MRPARAKALQEDLLKGGPVPYSIVRATQFMELMDATLAMTTDGDTVRLPRTPIQPIAAAEVATIVAEVAAGTPLNGVLNIVGPDAYPLDELGRLTLTAKVAAGSVVTDDAAGMFTAPPETSSPLRRAPVSPPRTARTGSPRADSPTARASWGSRPRAGTPAGPVPPRPPCPARPCPPGGTGRGRSARRTSGT